MFPCRHFIRSLALLGSFLVVLGASGQQPGPGDAAEGRAVSQGVRGGASGATNPADPADLAGAGSAAEADAAKQAAWSLISLADALPAYASQDADPTAIAFMVHRLRSHAAALDPDEPEIARLAIASAVAVGRREDAAAALTPYLRLRPNDEAAQWLLIQLLAERQQTAEQRAELLLRIADSPGSGRLSSAVRSYAALTASGLLEQSAQEQRAHQALRLAIQLDPTNTAAARRAVQVIASKSPGTSATTDMNDMADAANALLNVLGADPFDPVIRARIAELALGIGVPSAAFDWYNAAFADRTVTAEALADPATLQVINDRALAALASGRSRQGSEQIEKIRDNLVPAEGDDPENRPVLPEALHAVLIALLDDARQTTAAWTEFELLVATLESHRPAADTPGEIDWLIDRIQLPLLLNHRVDQVRPFLDRLAQLTDSAGTYYNRLAGWYAFRTGNNDRAIELLSPLRETDAAARYVLAIITNDDTTDRLRAITSLYQQSPRGLIGALAAQQIRQIGSSPQPAPSLRAAAEAITSTHNQLRAFPTDPSRSLKLVGSAITQQWSRDRPLVLRLTLTNTSPIPLSIGPGSAHSGRALILVRAINQNAGAGLLQTVQLQRRLRLGPGQSNTVEAVANLRPLADLINAPPPDTVLQFAAVLEGADPASATLITNLALQPPQATITDESVGSRNSANSVNAAIAGLAQRLVLGINETAANPSPDAAAHDPHDSPILRDLQIIAAALDASEPPENDDPVDRRTNGPALEDADPMYDWAASLGPKRDGEASQ